MGLEQGTSNQFERSQNWDNLVYNSELDFKSPEAARETFEQQYERAKVRERPVQREDGTEATYVLYEVGVNVGDDKMRQEHMSNFLLTSAQAGYKEARTPVVLPTPHYANGDPKQPITYVYFTLEKPVRQQTASNENSLQQ